MIKVIHVLTDTNIGGAGIWLMNYLSAADRSAFDISVALPENALIEERIAALGIRVHTVRGIADASFSKSGVSEFTRLFKIEKPDIVHCHASLSARIAAKLCGIRVVNTRHCLEDAKPFPKNMIYGAINSALSDAVIAVSGAVADNLRRDGIPERKLYLIYNGVKPLEKMSCEAKAAKRAELGIPDGNTVVGIVARLEKVKRHDIFLSAARELRNEPITFLIIGTGSLEDKLKKAAADLGNVVFAGYYGNMSDIADVIDVCALTSDTEACPLSLIEAMTLAKPCVSCAGGGACEVISDGETGFVTKVGDAGELAEKLLRLAKSPDERKTLGEAGKTAAQTKFSLSSMAGEIESVYKSLANGGRNG